MINAKHHQEQSVEKQITGVLTTTKKETTENETIEEKQDPVSSVIEHFASIDQVTEQSKPDIRQLENTTEHFTTMLVKEKKESCSIRKYY
ncbi:hypothetical protein [Enterococcus durans]|uniref:hypothetical protein n=1 Tax=Enterococcus durans TaxID=53345 RepID=UPI0039A41DAF